MKARKTGKWSRSVKSCGGRQPRLPQGFPTRRGFSLVELLVVIGIIVILVGILIPTISMVRKSAYGAKTQQMISQLSAAIEAYHMDFQAYPGPLHNNVVGLGRASGIVDFGGAAMPRITMSENLFLALSGGLDVNAANVFFDPAGVSKGPRVLALTGTKSRALAHGNYVDNMPFTKPSGFTTVVPIVPNEWRFADGIATANDTIIPEYVDGYTTPLPILYLRARTGARTNTALAGQTFGDNAVITTGSITAQYDLEQILGYTQTDIGEGKDKSKRERYYTNGAPDMGKYPSHGLRSVTLTSSILQNQPPLAHDYPYDAYAYLGNPAALTAAWRFDQPRQKDGYILISAGPDRIYGTEDDICSFGSLFQSGQ